MDRTASSQAQHLRLLSPQAPRKVWPCARVHPFCCYLKIPGLGPLLSQERACHQGHVRVGLVPIGHIQLNPQKSPQQTNSSLMPWPLPEPLSCKPILRLSWSSRSSQILRPRTWLLLLPANPTVLPMAVAVASLGHNAIPMEKTPPSILPS